ncbi:hypothetical protein VNO77_50255 [Canavalia gladiata]
MALGATCVQRLDGSRDSAIHTKYRISLRSSSMQEPRYPLPRVILYVYNCIVKNDRSWGHRLRAHENRTSQTCFDSLAHEAPGFCGCRARAEAAAQRKGRQLAET